MTPEELRALLREAQTRTTHTPGCVFWGIGKSEKCSCAISAFQFRLAAAIADLEGKVIVSREPTMTELIQELVELDLYTKTENDWQLSISQSITEPVCPEVIVYEETKNGREIAPIADSIEEGMKSAIAQLKAMLTAAQEGEDGN
jgi:hypothetical protein